jgi:hypothetical protein
MVMVERETRQSSQHAPHGALDAIMHTQTPANSEQNTPERPFDVRDYDPLFIEMLADRLLARSLSRRQLLGLAGRTALLLPLANLADRAISETFIWNRSEPRIDVLDTDTPRQHQNRMLMFLPGLGVTSSSSYEMADKTKPYLQRYGKIAAFTYAQNGFTEDGFRVMADAFENVVTENGCNEVTILGHSAGLANAVRMLNAPVTRTSMLRRIGFSRGSGTTGPAYEYWENKNIHIKNVAAIGAPANAWDIRGGVQQLMAHTIDHIPDQFLRFGIVAKFMGNVVNNYTLDYLPHREDSERFEAAFNSALTDYSATAWAQQVDVLNYAKKRTFPGTFSPDVNFGVFIPTNPKQDEIVLAAGLATSWSHQLDIARDSIAVFTDKAIGHANISEHPKIYAGMITQAFFPAPMNKNIR